jgi:predicted transcriptional regulator
MALFEETGFSIHAHVSLNSIQRHFPKALRGFCRDALKDLVRQGYVTKHPTAGSMTYSLTNEGVNAIKEMLSHNRQVLEK